MNLKAIIVSTVLALAALSLSQQAFAGQQCTTSCNANGTWCNTTCF